MVAVHSLSEPDMLYAHQTVGAKWMLACRNLAYDGCRQRGGIVADDMGLGKTRQSLAAAKVHKATVPGCKVFVICPKSLIINWQREAAAVGVTLDGIFTNHVASFPEGHTGPFVLIVDEAHAFQDHKSQRTKKLLALCSGVKTVKHETKGQDGKVVRTYENVVTGNEATSVYLLTGTPAKNGRPSNLIPLLQAINHGLVRNWQKVKAFLDRYCGPKVIPTPRGPVTTYDGATHLDELHAIIAPSILRRLKADCLDLPAKVRTLKQADLTSEEEATYKATLARLKAEYLERKRLGLIKDGGDKIVFLNQLRMAGSVAKATSQTVIEMAEEILENGGQVSLWTCFKESAEALAAHFGVKALTGDCTGNARQQIIDDFQSGKQKVFVGIDKAGGVGITLTAGADAILVDRPWTPGDAIQLEDRHHRIGQSKTVNVVWVQHGVDSKVDGIVMAKFVNAEKMLSGKEKTLDFADVNVADIADEVIADLGWDR